MVPAVALKGYLVAASVVASIVASFAVAVDGPTLEMGSMAAHWRTEDFVDNPERRH